MNKLWKTAAAGSCAVLCAAAVENTAMLTVARYRVPIPGMPRTVQISDLHKRKFGKNQSRLLKKTTALCPELIVITGDLISRNERDFDQVEAFLCRLCEIAPVIAIPGNHEADLPPQRAIAFRDTMQRSGVCYAVNRTVTFHGIRFAGLSLSSEYYRGGGWLGYSGKRRCNVRTLEQNLGVCVPGTVLLAHNPACFPAYAKWGAKLTLSGHVHGGAVRLPFIGGLLAPERKFFPKYDKGLFRIGDAQMIVSGGLGKLRLFNPPQLVLIEAK